MGKVVRPVFGTPCRECGDQVPQARVRLLDPNRPVLCVSCASLKEARQRRVMQTARDNDIIIVRG